MPLVICSIVSQSSFLSNLIDFVTIIHCVRRMEAAQSIRTRGNVAHSRVNHHQPLLGNWNIFALTGKELELVEEAKRYHPDILGVSST